jgi:hypothetical protein
MGDVSSPRSKLNGKGSRYVESFVHKGGYRQWSLSNDGSVKAVWVQAKVLLLNRCFDDSENDGVLSWSKQNSVSEGKTSMRERKHWLMS